MNIKLFDYKSQMKEIKSELMYEIDSFLESGKYVLGRHVSDLEENLQKMMNVDYVLGVGNGTDAMEIALQNLDIGIGDEVIVPAFGYFAAVEVVISAGAVPIFVDIKEDTLNIDHDNIEKAITCKTKAIITIDSFGNPVHYKMIEKIVKKYKLKWISDACQAIGAKFDGKSITDYADITCFSLFPSKNLGAFGDAGIYATNDKDLYIHAKAISRHGSGQAGKESYELINGKVLDEFNDERYCHYVIGRNSRLDTIQAVILNLKLKYIDEWTKNRILNAKTIIEKCDSATLKAIITEDTGVNMYQNCTFTSVTRDIIVNELKSKGIETAINYPIAMHMQPAIKYLGYNKLDFPVAYRVSQTVFSIPCGPHLQHNEINYIIENLLEAAKKK